MLDKHSDDPLQLPGTQSPAKLQGCLPSPPHNKQQKGGTEGSSRNVNPLHENHKSVMGTVSPETSLATTATRDDFHCG